MKAKRLKYYVEFSEKIEGDCDLLEDEYLEQAVEKIKEYITKGLEMYDFQLEDGIKLELDLEDIEE